jgi:hypothetical protein
VPHLSGRPVELGCDMLMIGRSGHVKNGCMTTDRPDWCVIGGGEPDLLGSELAL